MGKRRGGQRFLTENPYYKPDNQQNHFSPKSTPTSSPPASKKGPEIDLADLYSDPGQTSPSTEPEIDIGNVYEPEGEKVFDVENPLYGRIKEIATEVLPDVPEGISKLVEEGIVTTIEEAVGPTTIKKAIEMVTEEQVEKLKEEHPEEAQSLEERVVKFVKDNPRKVLALGASIAVFGPLQAALGVGIYLLYNSNKSAGGRKKRGRNSKKKRTLSLRRKRR